MSINIFGTVIYCLGLIWSTVVA